MIYIYNWYKVKNPLVNGILLDLYLYFDHVESPLFMTFHDPEHLWTSFFQEKLTAVSADYQSAGRGTGERSWHGSKAHNCVGVKQG